MLRLSNLDDVPHHYELAGAKGNLSHHAKLVPREKTGVRFAPERGPVRFGCRIHPWEVAWVAVVSHPYHFVTGKAGKYGIAQLPPGEYTFEVWHEAYRPVSRKIAVEADRVVKLDFTLDRLKP